MPASGNSTWFDSPSTATPITAARLNAIEAALKATAGTFLPQTYGAAGDGTTDDTTAVQTAIDAATGSGGTVHFGVGTYSLANVTWKAGVTYSGIAGKSILQIRTGAAYLGSCDSGSSSAFITGMTFRDLVFRGRIDTDTTFDQQRHLLNLNGVADVLITTCAFVGWHGDAIYLGSSNSGGVERHNQRVKIVNCSFDGLTKNNRNCVSIIDGDDVLVSGCTARRFSRSDMPGFVDVEPNAGSTYAICRDIKVIGNTTSDHNGTGGFFQANLPNSTFTVQPARFVIANNTMNAPSANFMYLYQTTRTVGATTPRNDITVTGNVVNGCARPWEISGGIAGLKISNNLFNGFTLSALIGYYTTSRYIEIKNNDFAYGPTTDGAVINIIRADWVQIIGNNFDNVGLADGTYGEPVKFGTDGTVGASTNIDAIDNVITGTRANAFSEKSAAHTLSASTNRARGNKTALTVNAAHFGTS